MKKIILSVLSIILVGCTASQKENLTQTGNLLSNEDVISETSLPNDTTSASGEEIIKSDSGTHAEPKKEIPKGVSKVQPYFAGGYSSKDGKVFFKNIEIIGADSSTFVTTSTGIAKDKNNTYFNNLKNFTPCLAGVCLPEGVVMLEDDKNYVGELKSECYESECEIKEAFTFAKDRSFIEIKKEEIMSYESTKVVQYEGNYLKSINSRGCGSLLTNQSFLDKNGKNIPNFELKNYPYKTIKIGNIDFSLRLTFELSDSILDITSKKISENPYNNINEAIAAIKQDILTQKQFYPAYYFSLKAYPEIWFLYESKQEYSLRVVNLGKDTEWLQKNISSKGELLDLSTTNKIIGYFGKELMSYSFTDKNFEPVTQVTKDQLPVFRVDGFDKNGNYLLYVLPYYQANQLAELCKPVVYYYSDTQKQNTLQVNLVSPLDSYTKLIPNFNEKNAWKFSTDTNHKIFVEKKKYDYLYYSILSSKYQHNTDGWIVKGGDIEKFFDEKLSKMNFLPHEKKDFIEYWKHEYEKEKYYFVSFKFNKEVDELVGLQFKYTPDNQMRVLLDSYEYSNFSPKKDEFFLYKAGKKDKKDAYLLQNFSRGNSNIEVFEWGGVLRKGNEIIIK